MPELDNKVVKCNDQAVGYGKLYNRSTKYLLTFNNPKDHGIDHEVIKKELFKLDPIYYCMSDEIGLEEHTPHTHVYVVFTNARHFNKIKKTFPTSHIDQCFGTHQQCIDYVLKEGEWEGREKGTTNLRETHEEYGIRPENHQGQRNDQAGVMDMIRGGAAPEDILYVYPEHFKDFTDIQKVIQYYKTLDKKPFRHVEVVYICGPTGTGKTSYVMDRYGEDVYRVTDYDHPFDGYNGEKVMIFDEFKGKLRFGDMLNYLDGHRHPLPARYMNREPEYEKVYIISNTEFRFQYMEEMHNDPHGYGAWIRRFRAWMYFPETGEPWVSTDYEMYERGFGISLDEFEQIEAREDILIPIEIEKHRLDVETKNAKRRQVKDKINNELSDKVNELNELKELTIVDLVDEEDEDDGKIKSQPVEENSQGEQSDEENS